MMLTRITPATVTITLAIVCALLLRGGEAAAGRQFPHGADAPAPQQQAEDGGSDGLTQGARVVAVAVVLVSLVALAIVVSRRVRRRRRQLAIVRPNLDHAVTQGLPNVPAMTVDKREDQARMYVLGPAGVRSYEFGSVPLRIGSATDSDVRVEASPDVAPRHAAIYMRDRKIVLRHTGGSRRPTLVAGQAIDLVMLDDGDEFTIGPHKFRAEKIDPQMETDVTDGLIAARGATPEP